MTTAFPDIQTDGLTWFQQFAPMWNARYPTSGRKGHNRQVYCVTEGAGMPVKIGIAFCAQDRAKTLQMATWRPVHLCWYAPAFSAHEAALKQILRPLRLHGEWFVDADSALKNALNAGASMDDLEALICRLAAESKTPVQAPRRAREKPFQLSEWVSA